MKISIGDKVHFNGLEIVVFCLGLLLTLGLIGYLTYEVVVFEDNPPQLEVTSSYQPSLPDYTYEVIVKNDGEETATNVEVKMTLYQGGKAQESGVISIAYVPVQSEQTGLITFGMKRQPADSLVVSSITLVRP